MENQQEELMNIRRGMREEKLDERLERRRRVGVDKRKMIGSHLDGH
jgi:hypothetical protein